MNQAVSVPLYYTFNQNNSGGWFQQDDRVCNYVIVQAVSAADANARAEGIGIYFNGVDQGSDCECCGDRWSPAWEGDGTEQPEIYGQDPRVNDDSWTDEGKVYCRIYHLDGIITEIKQ